MVKAGSSEDHVMGEGKVSGEGMRIGFEYQAELPECLPASSNANESVVEPLLVWAPYHAIPESEIDSFLKLAKEKHGYNMEQALGMLYWHKYDVEKALEDLTHFTPLPDEWSMEDRVIFDQSFHSYGKSFSRIKQQLPDKSIGSLVKYYYTWKRNRNKSSLMDKEAKKINLKAMGSINALFNDDDDGNDSEDSDYEPDGKLSSDVKPSPMLSTNCVNCAGVTAEMHPTPRGKMCSPCFEYWKRTGILRPEESLREEGSLTALYRGPQHKLKKKPPKGMQLSEDALLEIAQAQADSHIRPFDAELINLRRLVVTNSDVTEKQKAALVNLVDVFRPPELLQKSTSVWTKEELLIAVQCVRRYGKDFHVMAEILGNKSVSQCHNFFVNYRRRYNLMDVLHEYEKEHNIPRSEPPTELLDEQPSAQSPAPTDKEKPTMELPKGLPSHPPALRRETESSLLSPVGVSIALPMPVGGPPPLVSSATTALSNFSVSSLSGKGN